MQLITSVAAALLILPHDCLGLCPLQYTCIFHSREKLMRVGKVEAKKYGGEVLAVSAFRLSILVPHHAIAYATSQIS